MPQPLITLTLSFLSGLFLAQRLHLSLAAAESILTFTTLLLFAFLFFRRNFFTTAACLFFLPLGLFYYTAHDHAIPSLAAYADGVEKVIEGVIEERKEGDRYTRFTIKGERLLDGERIVSLSGRLQLTLRLGGGNLHRGDRIRFMARLRQPRNFNNPGGFDYEGYLRRRGITATATLKDDRSVAVMGDEHPLLGPLSRFRTAFGRMIETAAPAPASGVIKALSLGNRRTMEETLLTAFRRSGLAHILAVSGLHMGMVALFFYTLSRWALARSEWFLLRNLTGKGAALFTLFPLTAYLLLSGMATPAVRAYIMAVAFLISLLLEREGEIFNTLSLAALVILVVEPTAFSEASFQLSFAAVIGIVALVPKLEQIFCSFWKESPPAALRKFSLFIFVSFTAMVATAPLVTYHFMEISTVGLLSNLLVLPFLAFIVVPLSALALFTAPFSASAATLLLKTAALFTLPAVQLTETLGGFSFASLAVSPPAPFNIILYYALLFALFNVKQKRALTAVMVIPVLFLLSESALSLTDRDERKLEVTFLSVGQGESTFIRFPGGKTMVIDGGGFYDNSFDIGGKVIKPFLLKEGVKKIDYLLLSHPHPDHMNGLISLVKSFPVGEVWVGDEVAMNETHRLFLHLVEKTGIRKVVVSDRSEPRLIDGVRIEFLNPLPGYGLPNEKMDDSAVNGRSVVLKLGFGSRAFLLTGDLEREGEERLLYEKAALGADVIKVPHHGSLTSSRSAFVSAVSPAYAIFTVGAGNRFGFPKPEVAARYREIGARLLRTDRDGAVTFLTDGETLEARTFFGTVK